MHLCLICHEYPPCNHGGIGSFTKDLAEYLVNKENYKVTVIGFYLKHDLELKTTVCEQINGVDIIRVPRSKTFKIEQLNTIKDRLLLYKLIKKVNKEEKISLLESPGGSGWLPLGTPNKIPLITRLHGGEVFTANNTNKKVSKLIYFFEKNQIKHSKKIIAVSKFIGNEINRLLNLNFNFQTIYNSVDNIFLKNYNSIKTEKGLIVFAGTIRESKGVKNLIKACNIIFEQNSSTKLILAGRMTYKNEISYETIVRKELDQRYQNRVNFVGPLKRETELLELYMKADICCFPSFFESFSLVPLEAMALGNCIIFTNTTSGKELIDDNNNGILVNPFDYCDIASKVINILSNDKNKEKIAKNAKKTIYKNFSFDSWINQNIELYKRLNNDK